MNNTRLISITMKKFLLLCSIGVLLCFSGTKAQDFDRYFEDKSIRIDYQFVGNAQKQAIYLDELVSLPHWAGRRHHLDKLPVEGNGNVTVKHNGTVIYRTSFSSLFQEWITTPEARTHSKGFENSFLIPFPKQEVEVRITLYNPHRQVIAEFTHTINPTDILIRQMGHELITPHKYLEKNGHENECIDVAILAEGYTSKEMDLFYADAQVACQSIFSHEPFKQYRKMFNIVAVASESADSGVSIPKLNQWKNTAFSSHFSTFYSDRYLTTSRVKSIHNALAGIPYEHIIILANTEEYGGGGIYNSYTLTTAHHRMFRPVVVHEFGHSFAALADEYFYEKDTFSDFYPLHIEPWEQNITTLVNFDEKWKDMLPPAIPCPTPTEQAAEYPVGIYEGGGYAGKGVYRPADDCRMRTNEYPTFCPVCQRAITRMIKFYIQ